MTGWEIRSAIAELTASCPYDGRSVVMRERRGGWRYTGLSGTCVRLSGSRMVLLVEHDPEGYWPIGAEVLVEIDGESVPVFTDVRTN